MNIFLQIMKKRKKLFASFIASVFCLGISQVSLGQSFYWGGTAAETWNAASGIRWGTVSGGPYTTTWINGKDAIFNVANSTITGAAISVASITANENVIVTAGVGNLGTGSKIIAVTVAAGKTFNFQDQRIATAAGTGFRKEGAGTLTIANTRKYPGGFILNAGAVIIESQNALGFGGSLTVNGGTLAASSLINITQKYVPGIIVGGDFTFGNATAAAGLSFDDNVDLGSAIRTITLGSTANYGLNGIISGAGGGITLAAVAAGKLSLTGVNTYDGLTTVNGGTLELNNPGGNTLPVTNSIVVNSGATLLISSNQTLNNLTIASGGTLTVPAGITLTINGTLATAATITNAGTIAVNGNFQINQGGFGSGGTWTYGPSSTLVYNNTSGPLGPVDASHSYWPITNGPANVTIQGGGGISMGDSRSIGGLNLINGNLIIGSNTLTINGAVSRSLGNLAGSDNSNLIIGGAAGGLYFDNAGTNNYLRNFTINTAASATLANALNITAGSSINNEGVLTIAGSGVLTTGGLLTIKSNSFGTARIAPGATSGGYINGDVTIERFIQQNTNKAWRLLASNTSGQTIKEAWQENQSPLANGNPGFGTMIAGPFSSLALAQGAGYDTLSPGSSLLRYQSATNTLLQVANTNAIQFSSEQGYFLFVRGDRSPNQFSAGLAASTSTTLRSKGVIYQGNQAAINVPAEGKALIGNPFASALDMRNVTIGGGMADAFKIWDPKLAGSSGVGGYQTLTKSGADYVITPGGGSYPASGSIYNTIESGAAFYVDAVGTVGTVQINESSKTNGSKPVFRPADNNTENVKLITNLYLIEGSAAKLADGNMILFNAANNNAVDIKDVRKNSNFGEDFGIAKGNNILVVERKDLPTYNENINFYTANLKQSVYQIEIIPFNLNRNGLEAILEDSYLKSSTPVSLVNKTVYKFTVDGNAVSNETNRFKITFKKPSVLPLTLFGNAINGITVSPNPVQGNRLNLQFNKQPTGKYSIVLTNTMGQIIYNKITTHSAGNASHGISLPTTLTAGIYQIEIIAPDKTKQVQKLVINTVK